jgi:two-component system, response regulator PdtaR
MRPPTRALRIAVADDEPEIRQFFQELLPRLGHEVVVMADNGRQLVEQCRTARPDLVITDIKMPDMDGLKAAEEVNRDAPVPVIVVTGHHDDDLLAQSLNGHVMAFLSKPAKPVDLQAAINLAMLRFAQFDALRNEAMSLRQALEDRKIVERAKGAVMKRLRLDETDAFRRMRKLSSDTNRKLVELAQIILKADEVFQTLEQR